MKPKLFFRLLKKFRQNKTTIEALKLQVSVLKCDVVAEQRKVRELEHRLKALVCSTSWIAHEQDQVRMQIAIDRNAIRCCKYPDLYFQEAVRQLADSLKRDIMK